LGGRYAGGGGAGNLAHFRGIVLAAPGG
jgi:hypothetical protein